MHVYNRLEERTSIDERLEAGPGFKGGQEHRGLWPKTKHEAGRVQELSSCEQFRIRSGLESKQHC